jgi:anti-repressor protein
MNQLEKLFEYQNMNVRVVIKNNEPWFVAKDICKILELSDVSMSLQRLNSKMKDTSSICTLGGNQEMSVVSESGVYKLVFTSRKPEAEKFTDWLAEEVLPSIRKHGMYAKDELLDNPDLLLDVVTKLKEIKDRNNILEKINEEQRLENIQNQKIITEQKPKVEFANAVTESVDCVDVRKYSLLLYDHEGIKMGRNKLFTWFRANKYLDNKNIPYRHWMQYFKVIETTATTKYGTVKINYTTLINGKGQLYFYKK